MLREINFDGIIGPSHNYAGLSHGNLAATRNAGKTSHPKAAALQGIAKMRAISTWGWYRASSCRMPDPIMAGSGGWQPIMSAPRRS
ncbi:hypothetical protein GCM10020258_44130 [Sphingomonas yabuuchiae]